MPTTKKPTFKKDGTVFGNLFRLLLALLILSVFWFIQGFNWGHNHGHDLFEYTYVRDQYLGFHYSLALTFVPAVIIGCVLGSMAILGPFLLSMNAIDTNAKPKFYLGFLVSLAVMATVSAIPAAAAYLNHQGKGAPLFAEPPRRSSNASAPLSQPQTVQKYQKATFVVDQES